MKPQLLVRIELINGQENVEATLEDLLGVNS